MLFLPRGSASKTAILLFLVFVAAHANAPLLSVVSARDQDEMREAAALISKILGDDNYVTVRTSGIDIQFREDVSKKMPVVASLPAKVREHVTRLTFREKMRDDEIRMCMCFPKTKSIDVKWLGKWPGALSEVVAGFKDIEDIWCQDADVSGPQLKCIGKMTHLRFLMLGGNPIRRGDCEPLKNLTELNQLDLDDTEFSDDDLKWLKGMKKLTSLSLRGTSITDRGLADLADMKSLEILIIKKTKVTPEGVKNLRKSIPRCFITSGDM